MDQPVAPTKSGGKLIAIILIVVGVLFVLGVIGLFVAGKIVQWGYNRAVEATEEGVVKYDFDESGSGSGVFQDEEGNEYRVEARGEGESLIKGFPKDFPIMPGTSNLESGVIKDLNQIKESGFFGEDITMMYTAGWLTDKSVRETFDFYRSAFKNKEWRVLSADMLGETIGTMSFERQDGSASGMLTISESETDPGKTEISTFVGLK